MAEALRKPDQMHVLAKAVISAAERLAISHDTLASMLGVSMETVF